MALGLFQICLGAGSVWFNGWLFGGNPKAKFVWKYHRWVTCVRLLALAGDDNCFIFNSLSGYIILPLFLLSIHLGGAWSSWSNSHSVYIVRLLAFSISPIVLLGAVLSRIRWVLRSAIVDSPCCRTVFLLPWQPLHGSNHTFRLFPVTMRVVSLG